MLIKNHMPVIQMFLLEVGRPQPGIYLCFILENLGQDVYNPTSMKKDSAPAVANSERTQACPVHLKVLEEANLYKT